MGQLHGRHGGRHPSLGHPNALEPLDMPMQRHGKRCQKQIELSHTAALLTGCHWARGVRLESDANLAAVDEGTIKVSW